MAWHDERRQSDKRLHPRKGCPFDLPRQGRNLAIRVGRAPAGVISDLGVRAEYGGSLTRFG